MSYVKPITEMQNGNRGAALMRRWILWMALLISELNSCEAYNTYIVGDDIGWVAKFTNPINYTEWASNKTFSLGDTLVFNYAANHTVEQSNSFDTYLSCDSNDNNDTTVQYWSSEGSTQSVVPLTSTGTTYFLCTAYDGSHCLEGMRFPITVAYGQGLPPTSPPSAGDDENQSPDLNNGFQLPPPPPPGSVPSTSRGAHPPKVPQLFNLICLFFFSAAASMGALL